MSDSTQQTADLNALTSKIGKSGEENKHTSEGRNLKVSNSSTQCHGWSAYPSKRNGKCHAFREARDKVVAVESSAAKEANEVMQDTGSELTDMVPDPISSSETNMNRMSQAGTRILDEVQDESEKQSYGSREARLVR